MAERVREVLFETRHHASGIHFCNDSLPRHPPNEGAAKSSLSSLLPQSIVQLKERWTGFRSPRKLQKYASLFVSPRADHVAVAVRNQITILQKEDNYQEPTGIFISRSISAFVCGTWSEAHDVLGVVDDSDTLYFVKSNGEEITRSTKKQLKISLPILGLILRHDSTDAKKSCLCTFSILASDGSLLDIEISQDPSAPMLSADTSPSEAPLEKQFPKNVVCMDHNSRLSLFATVSSAGSIPFSKASEHPGVFKLSLWRRSSCSDLVLMISTEFEGLYSESKGYARQLTSPKVLISPQGKFIATLDLRGCLLIFEFHKGQNTLSSVHPGKRENSRIRNNIGSQETENLNDILDFTWWSDDILVVAGRDGTLTMFDVCTGVRVSESNPVYSTPILERVEELSGCIFVLENKPFAENHELCYEKGANEFCHIKRFDWDKLQWNLVSFSEASVSDMYNILIHNQEYRNALNFADRHGLDKDEVLKSQWLLSAQGVNEINTLLSAIKDIGFVLSECTDCVGPTEEAEKHLLAHGLRITDHYRISEPEDDDSNQIWDFRVARLRLLQFRDRLETFLGINMGRFSMQEYTKFRNSPMNKYAIVLAESGKIGALNLLFKRHPYSLSPFTLEVLDAIPETIPVQTYAQLLPGNSPPANIALREEDWVECDKMVSFINRLPANYNNNIQIRTEPIVKKDGGFQWPSTTDLAMWYKSRARDIDTLSGQLDNCIFLIEFAYRKGISELKKFLEDISYLHQLIYSDYYEDTSNICLSLSAWEQLSDYERFKLMLVGVKEGNVIERLQKIAIPFMQKRSSHSTIQSRDEVTDSDSTMDNTEEPFLVRWLKEISSVNKLEIVLIVIEEGCQEMENNCFFRGEAEVVDCAVECIYLCSAVDRWTTMASIISKLPHLQGLGCENLKGRLKLVEGHIEAGRLLAIYEVPKPISFFLEAHTVEKGVKQILRLILSKFIRRQLGRSDNDWANLWHDLLSLQEKAFPFLELEYILIEFCRGLLKAGKFSLARNYFKGMGSVGLAGDKAENLVIQAAREYFFAASSLDCPEIWKAKECLNILPTSRNARAEADLIDAVTVKLPNLGVNVLPMQFRQMKDPMELIKLAITSQAGAYLNVDEIIEVAKLLGLSSQDEISAVQEAIAREAAVAGDLQLAFDLCLVLARKGHGSAWDLCAALARGPAIENMDISSRKHLLGFSLSHCDEESIGELLHAWKDLDLQGQCETLMMLTGREAPESSVQGSSIISYPLCSTQGKVDLEHLSGMGNEVGSDDQKMQVSNIKSMLSLVAKKLPSENYYQWESLLSENGKILSFAALWLPWLIELTSKADTSKQCISGSVSGKPYVSIRAEAVLTTISWLARSGFAPRDDLIASIAKSIMEPPVTEEEDIIGCSFLLNLVDAFYGVDVIEGHVKMREKYGEINSIMNVGMIYGLLHNCGVECLDPAQRRLLLLKEFQQKQRSVTSGERGELDKTQTTFWKEWKMKLEEQKRVADQSRVLEDIVPGVETARFLSGDTDYIECVIFALIESVKLEKKHILKDVLKLAHTYCLDNTKVLLWYLSSILVSESWTIEDIVAEVSEFKKDLLASAAEAIKVITSSVYPMIDGHDKPRLAYIYGLLSECYLQLEEQKNAPPLINQDLRHSNTVRLAHFSKIVGQECSRVSFISGLNFKNVVGLQDLNWDNLNTEICSHIDENSVEALATMVHNLVGVYGDSVHKGILSWQDVYSHHTFNSLKTLETRSRTEIPYQSSENLHCFIGELKQTYGVCHKYLEFIEDVAVWEFIRRFFALILPVEKSLGSISVDSMWQECLVSLLNLWLTLMNDMRELKFLENSDRSFCSECLMMCLKDFVNLILEGKVSPTEGWSTVVGFISCGLTGGVVDEVLNFCKAMLSSGCMFIAIGDVFNDAIGQLQPDSERVSNTKRVVIQDLTHLYLSVLEIFLLDLASGSLERRNLHNFLSSLSKLEGNLEELKRVRHAVWKRMVEVSDNLELPNHVRLYILELMQCITAMSKLAKGVSSELQSSVLPWEGWENVESATENFKKTTDDGISNVTETSNRLTNTLVALKSSQLLSAISTSIEIRPEDLLTVESAVSCFFNVSKSAISESHLNTLIAILREWESLFVGGKTDPPKLSDDGNSWTNDDWDEGWESFLEEPKEKEIKSNGNFSVNPLHICWLEILKKLIVLTRYSDLLKLVDQYRGQAMQVLLDENGAHCLSQIALEIDCFLALKVVMLFPFEAIQLKCLDVVEDRLKQEGMPDELGRDHEFLILVLSSRIISIIVTKSSYGTTFSYICYMVGKFSHHCQEAQLSSLKYAVAVEDQSNNNFIFLFARLLFPCFISELVIADQQILAGFLVTKWMHTNASLSLVNVAEASLRMYFENQLQMLQDDESSWEGMDFGQCLINSITSLRSRFGDLIRSALALLPTDGR